MTREEAVRKYLEFKGVRVKEMVSLMNGALIFYMESPPERKVLASLAKAFQVGVEFHLTESEWRWSLMKYWYHINLWLRESNGWQDMDFFQRVKYLEHQGYA
jgi:hypothetical protein